MNTLTREELSLFVVDFEKQIEKYIVFDKMSSSEDNECEELTLTTPEIQETARAVIEDLLPPKSKEKYLKTYETFVQWKNERKSESFSENVFLAYFDELAEKVKPKTLWVIYSMLKCTVLMKHNVNIKQYANLTSMLKRQMDGYRFKKPKVFTASDVKKFLFGAPDRAYLDLKVILIFGIFGACRCIEITNITVKDVENHDGLIIVTVRDAKTKIDRTFDITNESAEIVQKYIALRPTDVKSDRFFLNYKNNKCTKHVIGRHKIAAMPKAIATYLNLPNPEHYNGHCFRQSSATVLADPSANLITNKRHGGWKSDRVAESYREESIETPIIIESTQSRPSTSHQSFEIQNHTEGTSLELYQTNIDKSNEHHEGFTCNSCSGKIIGYRYTCVQCANYDLCDSCEARGEHCHHYVLRIPKPAPFAEINAVLSKIRTQLLYGLDNDAVADREEAENPQPSMTEETIKVEIKEELPDPLEHEDAFTTDDNYTETDTTELPAPKETTTAIVPNVKTSTMILTESGGNLFIIENPINIPQTVPTISIKHKTTSASTQAIKRAKVEPLESEVTSEFMEVPVSVSAGSSTEGGSGELLRQVLTTRKPDEEASFQVFSHTEKYPVEAKPGPVKRTGKKTAGATTKKKKSDANTLNN